VSQISDGRALALCRPAHSNWDNSLVSTIIILAFLQYLRAAEGMLSMPGTM